MKQLWYITYKELQHYMVSLNAYVVAVTFLLLTGWFFASDLFLVGEASMRGAFQIIPMLLMIFIPAVTMRVFAEERKQGTLELLVTMPITDTALVLGKFLAVGIMVGVLLLATWIHPITLALWGTVDWGPVIGGYLGLWATGLAIASIGVWASSLTQSQGVSYIISLFVGFVFFLLSQIVPYVPEMLRPIVYALGFGSHFQNVAKGIIDSRDVLYYGSFVVFFLWCTAQQLALRNK